MARIYIPVMEKRYKNTIFSLWNEKGRREEKTFQIFFSDQLRVGRHYSYHRPYSCSLFTALLSWDGAISEQMMNRYIIHGF